MTLRAAAAAAFLASLAATANAAGDGLPSPRREWLELRTPAFVTILLNGYPARGSAELAAQAAAALARAREGAAAAKAQKPR